MMNTLDVIAKKYDLDVTLPRPLVIDKGRNSLGELFKDLGFLVGAEIGTERGLYAEILCKANPKLKLFCIDPWKAYPEYREHTTQSKIDDIHKEALKRLKPYNCKIICNFSEEAYKEFDDESLDFVYIDGNHDLAHTNADLTNWIPKVKSGGIVAGHDFVRYKGIYGQFNRVKDAVSKYIDDNKIQTWFVIRSPKERTSWMWIKK